MDLRSDTLRNRAGKDAPQSFQTPAQFSAMALKRAVTRPQTWARTRSRFNCIAVTSPKNWLRPLKSSLCRDEFLGMTRGRYAEQFVGRGRSVPEVLVEVGAARDEVVDLDVLDVPLEQARVRLEVALQRGNLSLMNLCKTPSCRRARESAR